MKKIILNFINSFLKLFNIKLVKVLDQFNNSYRVVLGLKNQQLVTLNFLVAQDELRLSTLLAIIFSIGFSVATCLASYFYFALKMKNRHLRKSNEKQQKELKDLRATPQKD